jgi:predicted nucleic acid-binding protein
LAFVLDASIAAAWALPDESSRLADRLLSLVEEDGAVVPPLWWYEIRNILLVAERRKRITASDVEAFLRSLSRLAVRMEELGDGEALLRLARKHGSASTMPRIWNWPCGNGCRWEPWIGILRRRQNGKLFRSKKPNKGFSAFVFAPGLLRRRGCVNL